MGQQKGNKMCTLIHRRRKVLNNWRGGARFRIFVGKGIGGARGYLIHETNVFTFVAFRCGRFYYFKFQLALECFIVRN